LLNCDNGEQSFSYRVFVSAIVRADTLVIITSTQSPTWYLSSP